MKQKIEKEAEQILLANYEKYYRLAYSYVRNEQDALDIIQESAYKVIKECGRIRAEEHLSTWIHRVVINTAIDLLRRNQKELVGLDGLEDRLVHEDRYEEEDPMELLNLLDEKDRTIVILKYFEEMKLEEIAQVLGENLSTVKARLYRSLKRLKLELKPDRIEENPSSPSCCATAERKERHSWKRTAETQSKR